MCKNCVKIQNVPYKLCQTIWCGKILMKLDLRVKHYLNNFTGPCESCWSTWGREQGMFQISRISPSFHKIGNIGKSFVFYPDAFPTELIWQV